MVSAVSRLAITDDVTVVINGPGLAVSRQADAGEVGCQVTHLTATVAKGVIGAVAADAALADDDAGIVDAVGDAAHAAEGAKVGHLPAAITEGVLMVVACVAFADNSAGIVNAVSVAEHTAKSAKVGHPPAAVTESMLNAAATGAALADDGAGTIDAVGVAGRAAESAKEAHDATAAAEGVPIAVVNGADDGAGTVDAAGMAGRAAEKLGHMPAAVTEGISSAAAGGAIPDDGADTVDALGGAVCAAEGAKVGHLPAAITEGVACVAAVAHDGARVVDGVGLAETKVVGGVLGAGKRGGARQRDEDEAENEGYVFHPSGTPVCAFAHLPDPIRAHPG